MVADIILSCSFIIELIWVHNTQHENELLMEEYAIMFDEKAKVEFSDDYEDEDRIILPIPYDDEAAEEARQREAEEKARMEALQKSAPSIVPTGYSSDESAELKRRSDEAEKARKEYEAALAKLKEAEALKESYAAQVAEAEAVKSGAEQAFKAAQEAEITFDADGNSIVKIVVPKNYDVVFNFKPKKN